jgi:hypothetical protein
MGYELTIKIGRIGNPRPISSTENRTTFLTDITIDLACCGEDSNITKLAEQSFSVYAQPKIQYFKGDEAINEDSYGSAPSLVPLEKVIEALKKDIKKEDYRRFRWALATLEAVDKLDDGKPCKEFNAIFEGH